MTSTLANSWNSLSSSDSAVQQHLAQLTISSLCKLSLLTDTIHPWFFSCLAGYSVSAFSDSSSIFWQILKRGYLPGLSAQLFSPSFSLRELIHPFGFQYHSDMHMTVNFISPVLTPWFWYLLQPSSYSRSQLRLLMGLSNLICQEILISLPKYAPPQTSYSQ